MTTTKRKYRETHPWFMFELALINVGPETRFKLAKAWSRCEQFSNVPLDPKAARKINDIYLVKGILATAALEGNTLTESEVQRHIDHDLELPPSQEYLGREIDNLVKAHRLIEYWIRIGKTREISPDYIKELNLMVVSNVKGWTWANPGETRDKNAVVGRHNAVPKEDCDYLLQGLCEWLNRELQDENGNKIGNGILRAIIARIYLAWIHPFSKGNCRTSGLVEFHLLLSSGLPSNAAHLLSIHYAQTRTAYQRQLGALIKNKGRIGSFVEYALQGFVDGQKELINAIQSEQINVHWRNHMHDSFRERSSKRNRRLKQLILDLSDQNEPVPISEIRYISPRIAALYANRSDKTVCRDLAILKKMGLLKETKSGISVKRELVVAFAPPMMQVVKNE